MTRAATPSSRVQELFEQALERPLTQRADWLAAECAGDEKLRADVQSLVAGNTFDRAKAKALIDAKTAAVQSKSPELIAAVGDFYDSLRPEQQQKVREFMQRGRHGWGR